MTASMPHRATGNRRSGRGSTARGVSRRPVHEAERARPLACVLHPARTPSGVETRAPVRRPIRRIRRHWPETGILLRGDSHHARRESMAWCEDNSVDFLFGLPINAAASAATRCSPRQRTPARCSGPRRTCPCTGPTARRPMPPKAGGGLKRRTIARINATTLAMDIRALVTSLTGSTPERLYEFDYCARGQAQNLIKLHKTQLKSDPTSCHSALASQVKLILHTAAYCLLCSVRRAIPETHLLSCARPGAPPYSAISPKHLPASSRPPPASALRARPPVRTRLPLSTFCEPSWARHLQPNKRPDKPSPLAQSPGTEIRHTLTPALVGPRYHQPCPITQSDATSTETPAHDE